MSLVINHHYPESDPDISRRLGRIEKALTHIIEKVEQMALDFSRIEAEIAENNSVIQSVVTLLQNVANAIRDAAADQAKVVSLADQLDTQTNALADAVAASTPAAPTE
jgi:signal transduction histidine kinase